MGLGWGVDESGSEGAGRHKLEARKDLQHLALLRISGLAVRFVPGTMDSFVSDRVTTPFLSAPEFVPKLSVHRGGQNTCLEGFVRGFGHPGRLDRISSILLCSGFRVWPSALYQESWIRLSPTGSHPPPYLHLKLFPNSPYTGVVKIIVQKGVVRGFVRLRRLNRISSILF